MTISLHSPPLLHYVRHVLRQFRFFAIALCMFAACLLPACMNPETSSKKEAKAEPVVVETARPSSSARPSSARPKAAASPAAVPAARSNADILPEYEGVEFISAAEVQKRIIASGAKGTIVNAWASWCGPCRREFPMLVSLRDNLKERGIDIVFVSVDEPDSALAAVDFARNHALEPPVLVAEPPLSRFKPELHEGWPGMLPATFLFDAAGKLRYFWGGPVYEKELLPVVEGLLEGKAIDGEMRFGLTAGKDYR